MNNYIYGTSPRKEVPREDYEIETREQYEERIRRRMKSERMMATSLPMLTILVIAMTCVLYVCISYLQVQSSIAYRIHNIEKLEQEIEKIKNENDALKTSIETSLDLDEVYRIATEELGMVHARKEQVLLYNQTENEYVRQYDDIPTD